MLLLNEPAVVALATILSAITAAHGLLILLAAVLAPLNPGSRRQASHTQRYIDKSDSLLIPFG
jgi:hypothetical protein